MKIVLLENVEHLGIVGDRKEVANGYARNFLIPNKLAVKQGDPAGKKLLKDISKKRMNAQKELKDLGKIAKELEGKRIIIESKAGDSGKLFGAISSAEVADKLKVDKKKVAMAPIKTLGEHKVKINLGHKLFAYVMVEVVELKATKKKETRVVEPTGSLRGKAKKKK